MSSKSSDVLVVGAGVAGCAIAVAFAKQDRRVVVERSLREPDRIVGELLQPGGVDALAKLGLSHCLEGIEATPVEGYHLYWNGQETSFWFCPLDGEKDAPFVSNLRRAVMGTENATLIEATAVEMIRDGETGAVIGAKCSRSGGEPEEFYASLTILADGSTSNFRSQFTRYRPVSRSRFWGLELVNAELPIPRYAYGILGIGGPILMYRLSNRETRVLIDIPDDIYGSLGSPDSVRDYIREHIVPSFPEPVRANLEEAVRESRLRSMPNASMPSSTNTTPGLVLLGDVANMRHPLTGSGMTVALKDAVLLAEMLSPANVPSLNDTGSVLAQLKRYHWKRKSHSASLNMLAQALYLLFVGKDNIVGIMQRGFVRYVQGGEKNFAEPAWIMGGIVDSPLVLFRHFFKIAFYSIGLHFQESGVLGFPAALVRSVLLLASAVRMIWAPIVNELTW